MDVDDLSLPDTSLEHVIETSPSGRTFRLPLGTVASEDDDDDIPLSAARLFSLLESKKICHRLYLSHNQLSDHALGQVLHKITKRTSQDILKDTQGDEHRFWLRVLALLSSPPQLLQPMDACTYIRELILDGNNLTERILPLISIFVAHNPHLRRLSLGANNIHPDASDMSLLAQCIGSSMLRSFCMSVNPITVDPFIAFFDALPAKGCSLQSLEFSNVLDDFQQGREAIPPEVRKAARAVARLVSNPRRCRNLRRLCLSGNGFGNRCKRTIYAALVGSLSNLKPRVPPASPTSPVEQQQTAKRGGLHERFLYPASLRLPNTSVYEVQMYGFLGQPWRNPSQDDSGISSGLNQVNDMLALIPPDRHENVVRYLLSRSGYFSATLSPPNSSDSGFEAQASQVSTTRSLSSVNQATETHLLDGDDANEIEALIASVGGDLENWTEAFVDAFEIDSGVQDVDEHQLREARRNDLEHANELCRHTALRVLAAARTLGCCASGVSSTLRPSKQPMPMEAQNNSPLEGFHLLPPELRLLVLRHLDDQAALSEQQFNNVISFACERSTIGYGEDDFDWNRIVEIDLGSTPSSSSTIPSLPWSWYECFSERGTPRDWFAEHIDPDFRSTMPGTASHSPPSPAVLAFWECTQTQCMDNSIFMHWQHEPTKLKP
ncbi:hypothetical protein BCV70DRAFT_88311 [Testicularia cyperi]|uniref:RNI-like protein n=1 Tax=Testicularia cyperi TaxID=1882483 RepID=A0A317XSD9_9BASI|nr:hypothetical protein BCV70DRAFT_88311 [Testicularia cyperi]